jgi:hypothetical protein
MTSVRNPVGTSRMYIKKFHMITAASLIDFAVIWPFIFCAFSFTLFYSIHPNSREKVNGYKQIPTLSQTGKLVPESLFFTFGLHLEGVVLAVLFILLYVYFKTKIQRIESKIPLALESSLMEENAETEEISEQKDSNAMTCWKIHFYEGLVFCCCGCCASQNNDVKHVRYLTFWNTVLLYLGLICALLMALVGTVTLDVETTVHGVIAFFMFLSAILHMVFYYFTIAKYMGQTPFQLNLLRFCLFMCIPFNIIMVAVDGIMYTNCPEHDHVCGTAAVDLITALEYSTAIFLILYIAVFRENLATVSLMSLVQEALDVSPASSTTGPLVGPEQEEGAGAGAGAREVPVPAPGPEDELENGAASSSPPPSSAAAATRAEGASATTGPGGPGGPGGATELVLAGQSAK